MKKIRIKLDYLHGPLWKDIYDPSEDKWSTGIACVDNDGIVQKLNDEAETIYSSLYSFEEEACRFDSVSFEQNKEHLKSLIQTMISRLDRINDGTYVVVDETEDM